MTVIAWDGKTLAADKLACNGSARTTVTKIVRAHDGSLLGICGDLSIGMEVRAWYENGAQPHEYPLTNRDPEKGASLVVVNLAGEVFKYESSPYPFRLEGRFCAFGCGMEAANVAMHCGKTSAEAVQIASLYTNGCGNGVDTLELD